MIDNKKITLATHCCGLRLFPYDISSDELTYKDILNIIHSSKTGSVVLMQTLNTEKAKFNRLESVAQKYNEDGLGETDMSPVFKNGNKYSRMLTLSIVQSDKTLAKILDIMGYEDDKDMLPMYKHGTEISCMIEVYTLDEYYNPNYKKYNARLVIYDVPFNFNSTNHKLAIVTWIDGLYDINKDKKIDSKYRLLDFGIFDNDGKSIVGINNLANSRNIKLKYNLTDNGVKLFYVRPVMYTSKPLNKYGSITGIKII